jgi:hypothetical protein
MKLLFIYTTPRTQEEIALVSHLLHTLGLTKNSTLYPEGKDKGHYKEYVVHSLSATEKKQSTLNFMKEKDDPLHGNEIIFVEQDQLWLAIDKANTVQISKTEPYLERIKSIIQNYHQTVPA